MKASIVVLATLLGLSLALPQSLGTKLKIKGGDEAEPHAYPYQVAIISHQYLGDMFCGGSLISNDTVLTTASCANTPRYVDVILGAHEINKKENTTIKIHCDKIILHHEWHSDKFENDIALIKLPEPVTLNEYIQTIELAPENEIYAGDIATFTGWGSTQPSSPSTSKTLRVLSAEVLSNEVCQELKPFTKNILAQHLCTSGTNNVGTCPGDFGGPLVKDGKQIGVIIYNNESCQKDYPSLFTRISAHYDWIKKHL